MIGKIISLLLILLSIFIYFIKNYYDNKRIKEIKLRREKRTKDEEKIIDDFMENNIFKHLKYSKEEIFDDIKNKNEIIFWNKALYKIAYQIAEVNKEDQYMINNIKQKAEVRSEKDKEEMEKIRKSPTFNIKVYYPIKLIFDVKKIKNKYKYETEEIKQKIDSQIEQIRKYINDKIPKKVTYSNLDQEKYYKYYSLFRDHLGKDKDLIIKFPEEQEGFINIGYLKGYIKNDIFGY